MKNIPVLLLVLSAIALGACARHHHERPTSAATTGASPRAINLQQWTVPAGKYGRRIQFPLRAQYITIHSTGNRGGTAAQHASGMARGAFRGRTKWNRTGYVTWHFTVDDKVAIQSLPLNIQGEHADHDGPGNKTSIAIEICEFRDKRRQAAALERAARLTAWLLRERGIPLDHVVPHYHWPQHHFHRHQKNCPRILLERGRPGPRWAGYVRKIGSYR